MIGKTVSHYRITEEVGHGAMGVVYLAEDLNFNRRVAIKTLNAMKGADSQQLRRRFQREAEAASALKHRHIATIYEFGKTDEGEPFIVMEYVDGDNLADLILKEKLTIPRSLQIIKEVADALGEAHRHGIIHRDIKPSNIALNRQDQVIVLDFGLAKQIQSEPVDPQDSNRKTLLNTQTREGLIVGTPLYLSPEQALGVEVDQRSDLFSLGAVLYECIAGRPPFSGNSPIDICAKVIRDEPPPPSQFNQNVNRELDRITLKALAKKKEERYQNADELISDLDQARAVLKGHSGATVTRLIFSAPNTQRSTAWETVSEIFRTPRLSIGYVAGALILILAVGYGISRWTRASLPRPTREAQLLYEKGVAAIQEGAYFKATKLLERAVAADEKFALAHARLAEAFAELDYTDKAKDQMLSASRLITDRSQLDQANALYFEAISATIARDLSGAINSYTEIVKLKSNEPAAFLDLGRAYENHDEVDKAIEQYSKAARLDGNAAAPLLRLAVLQGRRQDLVNSNAAFDQAEALYKDNQDFEGSSEVFFQRGYLLSQIGKIPEAQNAAQQSLAVAKVAENRYQQVRALLLIGSTAYQSGDTAKGQELVTQAIELARSSGLEELTTQGFLDLGYALMIKRSYDDAERYLRQGLELAQRFKEKRNEARANMLLGTLYIQKEDPDKGTPFINEALAFYQSGSYRREVSRCMMMIGRQQLLKGNSEGALKTLDEQLQLAKQVEDPGQLARSQAEVAAVLSKQDFYPQALVRFTESFELNHRLDNPLNTAFALLNRGDMLARLGRYDETNDTLDRLMPVLGKISSDNKYRAIWTAWSYLIRAQMALSRREFTQAKAKCQQALAVMAGPNRSTNTEASIKSTLCVAEVRSGSTAGLRLCEEAVALMTSSGDHADAETHLALAEGLIEIGKSKEALAAALIAQNAFAAQHRDESEWQAWFIAAQANQNLQQHETMLRQLSRARELLDGLRSKWQGVSFDSYLARIDISLRRQQMDSLAK